RSSDLRSTSASARWSARCSRRRPWSCDMATDAAPEPKANMGQPVPRLDARLKVTGEARYAADFPVANPAYAFLVTSAIAKGRITNLEIETARSVPGVLDILTQENTTELK